MKIIITAGGTTEKIDQVRRIANMATGALGSLTAEEFVRQGGGRVEKIYYICEPGTIVPKFPCVEVIPTAGVEEVGGVLSKLLTACKIDAVIHSMAVSDYTVASLTTAENLAEYLAGRLFPLSPQNFESESALADFIASEIQKNDRLLDRKEKIGSNIQNLMLTMKRTPKLIRIVKDLQPSAVLVGFKLLSGVEAPQLLQAGFDVLAKNSCDFVLANDLSEIGGGRHVGYLLSPDKSIRKLDTKAEIAREIARSVLQTIRKKAES